MTRNTKILDRQFVPAGTLVIEQGAIGNRAYMIESGSVEVFIVDAEGKELILSELGPGSLVGEMAAMSDGRRSASARTKEDSVLITLSAHDLQESMKASGSLYKRIMRMMVDRMRDTNLKLLRREKDLADAEKASQTALKNVAAHVSAKQEKLKKEISPLLDYIKGTAKPPPPDDPGKGA